MSDARFFHVTRTGKLAAHASPREALAAAKKGGYVWLDYSRPAKEELLALARPFGLHQLSIEDCFDENQIPKIESYHRNTFILFNTFSYADGNLAVQEVDVFLGRNFLITVSGQLANNRRIFEGIEASLKLDNAGIGQGPAFLLHNILDHIVDQKFLAIEALEDELDLAEESILANLKLFDPAGLLHLRRNLLAVRKSLFHEREIMVKLCRQDSPFVPDKAIYFYRDIYDHLAKFFELTESYREILTSLMDMYLSMVNNQMTHTANETNVIVRRLTFITTIFMPLTLLAGIGGMSEWTMITGGARNWKIAYPLFLLALVVIGVASYFVLKWIEGDRGPKQE